MSPQMETSLFVYFVLSSSSFIKLAECILYVYLRWRMGLKKHDDDSQIATIVSDPKRRNARGAANELETSTVYTIHAYA